VSSFVSVEARRETMSEVWTKWEGEVINGAFPLRRFLSGSDHGGVFLTEFKAQNLPNAAIKIVPVDPTLTEAQLSRWKTAATLSHPHLIRLFDAGSCQLGGRQFLFVVMEYAEENLSQILPHRALTPDEVREMLLPTLDALSFLHRKNLVHGQLKPPNFLVVDDQLKLASDTIRPAGESRTTIAESSFYDPPEAKNGGISAAGDVWALGITIVEALTQCPPAWPDERSEIASLPTSLPPTYVETVRRCLSRNPADRPRIADLEAQIKQAPQAPVVPIPQPVVGNATGRAAPSRKSLKQRLLVPTMAVLLIIFVAIWAGLRLFRSNSNSPEISAPSSGAKPAEFSASSSPVSQPSDRPPQPLGETSSSVLHEEIPDVPRSATNTIRGHLDVAVRVTVDSSGNVIDETLEKPGPSKYFARLATAAARKWKFAPADNQSPRVWLLRFEFSRGGTTGHAVIPRS
jgi:TonB family protein